METKARVLIADSGEDFRYLMADTIAAEEDMMVVGTAGDGVETLSLIEQKHPDILVMDLVLTKMDGLSVLQKLSQMPQKPQVVVVSGFFNDHVCRRRRSWAHITFMPKPCDVPALLERIRQISSSRKVSGLTAARTGNSDDAPNRKP